MTTGPVRGSWSVGRFGAAGGDQGQHRDGGGGWGDGARQGRRLARLRWAPCQLLGPGLRRCTRSALRLERALEPPTLPDPPSEREHRGEGGREHPSRTAPVPSAAGRSCRVAPGAERTKPGAQPLGSFHPVEALGTVHALLLELGSRGLAEPIGHVRLDEVAVLDVLVVHVPTSKVLRRG